MSSRSLGCLAALCAAVAFGPAARGDVVHQVRRGETLASIAQRYYGDVAREATIVSANVMDAQGSVSLLPGMKIVIPSVGYYRVQAGDTWVRIAENELGNASRAGYLAEVNGGNFEVSPSPGAVLRIPYLLRYVVLNDEPLFEIARRFYGDRSRVQFILQFNHVSSARLQRGQVLLLPLPDLILREEPVCENTAPLAAENTEQSRIEREIPALDALVSHGQFVEAVALGARLSSSSALTAAQRVAVDRALAEAYVALDRGDLAAEAFRDAIAAEPGLALDGQTTSPRVIEAFNVARGIGAAHTIDPAPPTARPEEAH